jgi:CarD family transcriptional regulator
VQAAAERGSLPGVAGVQSQTADAKIETSNPVTQKIQKNASDAAAVAGSDKAASVKSSDAAAKEPASAAAPKAEAPKPAPVAESRVTEPKPAESKPAEARPQDRPGAAAKMVKPGTPKQNFKASEFVVYPAHGVGQIVAIEEQEVAGFKLELFVISFIKDKMILKVPTPKSVSVGMRKLATPETVKRALNTLTGRARIKRTMWSRRAQEYEAKINSGDLVAIAEVVRDLYRSDAQPEQSYSERQLYEAALDRVAREIAVVQKLTETESLKLIESQLQKSPRRGKAEDADPADPEDGDVEEAA